MSPFAFVVYLLAAEAVVVVLSQPGDDEPTLTCANVDCVTGNDCHHVTTCSTCPIELKCIPTGVVKYDINFGCRRLNYAYAILLEDPTNTFKQLTCSTYQGCPPGSDCVGGLCCLEKVSVPITKDGICPKPQKPVCKATKCDNDYSCPGEQKCCGSCGKVCTDPVVAQDGNTCGSTRCPEDQVCVYRSPPCTPGRFCALFVLPVCVPSQCANCTSDEYCKHIYYRYECTKKSPCGVCAEGQVCVPAPKQCFTTPCPQFECVPNDSCGGCPVGQVCKRNKCTSRRCSSYKCYPATK